MKNKKITLGIVFIIVMSVLFPSLSTIVYATEIINSSYNQESQANESTTDQIAEIDSPSQLKIQIMKYQEKKI
ncbi:hypothetical protein CKN80_00180 [Carnobacterium divergens]|uniref:hypothetical protein n=1 Tax=Carnobacterium divergens TaxID=2748 RepID=UPI001071AC1C|nr:hypothetical protein [Carnobacterium divergens]TFJ48383.1 hypothetical protein CKN79_00180 [Carnobacterium divergens]TFJ54878.1 hypothetical protein CKN80_00180 [Carnobacterium divergens]